MPQTRFPVIQARAPPTEDLLSRKSTLGHSGAIFSRFEKHPVAVDAFFFELIDNSFGNIFKIVRSKRKDLCYD